MEMILHIFDEDINLIGMLDNYISLKWTEDYFDRGSFTLVCGDTEKNIKLLQENYFIYKKGKNTAMIIRYIQYNNENHTIEVNGYTTLSLIEQRIVYPMQRIKSVEEGMYQLVEEAFQSSKDRLIESISTERITNGLKGYEEEHETKFVGENLLLALTTLGAESEIGFFMKFDYHQKKHIFIAYKGLDRTFGQKENAPAVFSTEFGNLKSTIILKDQSIFRNVAYVLGEDKEGEEKVILVGNNQGLDRYEVFVDCKSIQKETTNENGDKIILTEQEYEELLSVKGIEKLNEYLKVVNFSGEVDALKFGTEYYLGDKVSCKSDKYKMRIDARIMQYTEVTENNITSLSVQLGEPEITFMQEVKTWL